MLERLIRFSIVQKKFIMMAVLGIAIMGIYNFTRLPIDAVPDITNVQVQINTQAAGFSPFEVEQRITYPLETVMAGLPSLEQTRSLSRYGLSQVTVVFKDGTDIYFARQLVNERLQEAKEHLPEGIVPVMGPIATGLGEILMWTVEAKQGAKKADGTAYTPTDLRTIQDWIIKPQLRQVPGVTEVNTIGGFERQIHVTPYPDKLIRYQLSLQDIIAALQENNVNVGAGYIERAGEQYLVRVPGQVASLDDIGQVVVAERGRTLILVKDVADVAEGKELRTGAATAEGKEEIVGTVFMLIGENSRTVSRNAERKLREINRTLPEGVVAKTVYDRTNLVDATIRTVEENLVLGALLVIMVLFFFLGNIRAALITAMVIPLAMFMTVSGMVTGRISANLMSLGALDFGIIIDGAIVVIENCIRRLKAECQRLKRDLNEVEREQIILQACREVQRTIVFGQLIIMIVYLPILTLGGVEGKMFVPMALTVVMALAGAMVLSLTFIPAAAALFLTKNAVHREWPVMDVLSRWYQPVLTWGLRHARSVITAAVVLVLASLLLSTRMGREFIPGLDEGDIAMHAMRLPGVSVSQAVVMQQAVEKKIMEFPEVKTVFSKIGTAEIANDPMPPNVADTFIMLRPRASWPDPKRSKEDLIASMEKALRGIPGNAYEFTQPIQMRFNELIAGVRSDVAVKVFGDDLDVLVAKGQEIAAVLNKVKGASDVKVEQITGLPMLSVEIDRVKLSRYGLKMSEVQEAVATAIGGKSVGQFFEGDKRFDMVVRFPEHLRSDMHEMRRIPVRVDSKDNEAFYVPLEAVADLKLVQGPNQISRENAKRRVVVTANVRGRDIGSFVEESRRMMQAVDVPAGYWIGWGGQFEQMISAAQRLSVVVPLALLFIFLLLAVSLKNIKDALLVLTAVPLALTGGILALWVRQMPLSISAGIGFIALCGVAVLNGLVMITFIRKLRQEGGELVVSIIQGAVARLRPVLMTAFVASLGFIPMALAQGRGAEVQRPLATVVIGGIISSTLLTLVVLPVLYRIFHRKDDIKQ